MFIVGRNTRGEEQSGRSELVRANVVGRDAPLAAALVVAVVAQLLMGAVTALVMIGADTPATGSIALGASLAAVGILFAGVAAVTVQVSQSTGGAYGLVGAVLGASYVLRAAGDVGDGTLSWLSPIGWGQAMRPYADERWWPLLLFAVFTALLLVAAFALLARRDDGAGLIAPGPGPPHAGPGLARPFGLALRLQRGALIGWAVGLFLGGLSIGLTAQDADSFIGDSDDVNDLFAQAAGSLIDNYLAISLLSMALIGSGFAIAAVLKMRSEETAGRLEPLLATALARPRWAAGYVGFAAAGTVAILAASGLGAGIADAANTGDLARVPLLVGSSIAIAPAVWCLIGLAVALFGLLPHGVGAAWAALGACYLAAFLGPLLGLPDWVMDISPFTHVPLLPAADVDWASLLALTAVAAALCAVGLVGFRRRNVPA
jgi:ABC-2 type transport system permease protein